MLSPAYSRQSAYNLTLRAPTSGVTVHFLNAGHMADDSQLSTGHSTTTTALYTDFQTMVMTFRHSFGRLDVRMIVLLIMLTVNS